MTHRTIIHDLLLHRGYDYAYGCLAYPETVKRTAQALKGGSFAGWALCHSYLDLFGINIDRDGLGPDIIHVQLSLNPFPGATMVVFEGGDPDEIRSSSYVSEMCEYVDVIPPTGGKETHLYTYKAMRSALRKMLNIPIAPFTIWVKMAPYTGTTE